MSRKLPASCLNSSLLVLGLLFFQSLCAQNKLQDLDQSVAAAASSFGKNYVVEIWKRDDTVVYRKEIGEMKGRTAAPIGLSSQWYTAVMVMKMVDDGLIGLDDKISRWLPEFEKYGKNYITIRHCLTHQTGIRDDNYRFSKKKFASLEEQVNYFASREIQTNPGTESRYNLMGVSIAGRILEVVSKKRFDQLLKQKLFNPLKMRNSSFTNPSAGAIDPVAGATSSADDYIRFLAMLLQNGTIGGQSYLSESSVKELFKIQIAQNKVQNAPPALAGSAHALGSWIMTEKNGTAATLAAPALPGSWPVIDICRGYALLVFAKDGTGDEKAASFIRLKEEVDGYFMGDCN